MNKTIGLQLVGYSLLLAGLSYLTHHLAPTLALPTLIAGLAGAGLSFLWGLLAVAGRRGKALPILTLIAISFVMFSQMILTWAGGADEVAGRRTTALVITALFVLSLGMLMRIAYTSLIVYGQPASPTKDGGSKSPTTGNPAAQGNAAKRA